MLQIVKNYKKFDSFRHENRKRRNDFYQKIVKNTLKRQFPEGEANFDKSKFLCLNTNRER